MIEAMHCFHEAYKMEEKCIKACLVVDRPGLRRSRLSTPHSFQLKGLSYQVLRATIPIHNTARSIEGIQA